jgi:hypothetical protein
MKKIQECRVLLMEKDENSKVKEEGKASFIIRTSGNFMPEEYLRNHGEDIEGEFPLDEYKEFLLHAISAIYDNVKDRNKDNNVDTVGLFLVADDGREIDSSMDMATLDAMREFNADINPMREFAKMILDNIYESEDN